MRHVFKIHQFVQKDPYVVVLYVIMEQNQGYQIEILEIRCFFFKSGVFQENFFSKTGEKSGDLF
jgi:hypothetical protein